MAFLPENTILGKLELLETFEYYDKPVLFACRNATDELFLVVLEDEDDDVETWLYVGLSQLRFNHVRSGSIDLRTAFIEAENNFVYEVRLYFDNRLPEVAIVSAQELNDDQLPIAGENLSLTTPTLAVLDNNLGRKAEQAQREYVAMSLEFDDRKRTEAPAKILGHVLEAVQDIVNSLGLTFSELHQEAKKVTKDLSSLLELSVVNVGAGSFKVEMASSNSGQLPLLDADLMSDVLQAFVDLINSEPSPDNLKEILASYRVEVAREYLTLLQAISHSKIDETNFEWASPRGRSGSARLSTPKVFATIEVLKDWSESTTQMIEVIGELTGLYKTGRRNFQIEDREGQKFDGVVSRDVSVEDFEVISKATISQRYKATLRMTTTIRFATNETSVIYELMKFETPAH